MLSCRLKFNNGEKAGSAHIDENGDVFPTEEVAKNMGMKGTGRQKMQ